MAKTRSSLILSGSEAALPPRQSAARRQAPVGQAPQGFWQRGCLEVIEDHDVNTYRAVYTVRFSGAVYWRTDE
jgi:hypothetical protein